MKYHKKETLVDKTYKTLKKAILNLELPPKTPLIEEKLAKQLNISRTPLRAALARLEYENLVEIIPGKCTYVTELSYSDMVDIFNVREAVEGLSANLAAKMSTEKDLQTLEQILHQQEHVVKFSKFTKANIIKFIDIDQNFHYTLAAITKNDVLKDLIIKLNEKFRRFVLSIPFHDRTQTIITEHKQILRAIRNSKDNLAELLMREHIKDIKKALSSGLKHKKTL